MPVAHDSWTWNQVSKQWSHGDGTLSSPLPPPPVEPAPVRIEFDRKRAGQQLDAMLARTDQTVSGIRPLTPTKEDRTMLRKTLSLSTLPLRAGLRLARPLLPVLTLLLAAHLTAPQTTWGERGLTALGTLLADAGRGCRTAATHYRAAADWWAPAPTELGTALAASLRSDPDWVVSPAAAVLKSKGQAVLRVDEVSLQVQALGGDGQPAAEVTLGAADRALLRNALTERRADQAQAELVLATRLVGRRLAEAAPSPATRPVVGEAAGGGSPERQQLLAALTALVTAGK